MRLRSPITGDEASDDDVVAFLNWVSLLQHFPKEFLLIGEDMFYVHCGIVPRVAFSQEDPPVGIIQFDGGCVASRRG